MGNIAIIPARGGSKRIPGKNIRLFLGEPIIAYSIRAAVESKLFDKIIVSTDSREIAEIAVKYGAEVPFFRSVENSGDYATTASVIQEVLNNYRDKNWDNICCLYPCAPFVTGHLLQSSYEVLINGQFDSVIPVLKFGFPVQRAMDLQEGKVSLIHEEFALTRSQDLPPRYHDAGQFYWLKAAAFLKSGKLFMKHSGGVLVSELSAQDIDNEVDWQLAELKFKLREDGISK
jgi:pseudaminic acid cytidylyltransferase